MLGLCLRGPLTHWGRSALAAAALWGLLGPSAALAQQTPLSLRDPAGETNVVADRMQQIGGDTDLLLATGNVEITRGGTRLMADRVELNRATGEAVAQGKVVFFDGQDRLVGVRVQTRSQRRIDFQPRYSRRYRLRSGNRHCYRLCHSGTSF